MQSFIQLFDAETLAVFVIPFANVIVYTTIHLRCFQPGFDEAT
jgi:hypothetical protein